jgi:hypothetical protein
MGSKFCCHAHYLQNAGRLRFFLPPAAPTYSAERGRREVRTAGKGEPHKVSQLEDLVAGTGRRR